MMVVATPAGFEPATSALKAVALSPELRFGSLAAATAAICGVCFSPKKPPRQSPTSVSALGQLQILPRGFATIMRPPTETAYAGALLSSRLLGRH